VLQYRLVSASAGGAPLMLPSGAAAPAQYAWLFQSHAGTQTCYAASVSLHLHGAVILIPTPADQITPGDFGGSGSAR
jgi:hypothetical protein